ncbi:MAG: hypothetical protein NTZ78_00960 [Candidatus Aureabacteria bacterium]|nr:hypothetical protein [Candidatus Auribacterota bacterium]
MNSLGAPQRLYRKNINYHLFAAATFLCLVTVGLAQTRLLPGYEYKPTSEEKFSEWMLKYAYVIAFGGAFLLGDVVKMLTKLTDPQRRKIISSALAVCVVACIAMPLLLPYTGLNLGGNTRAEIAVISFVVCVGAIWLFVKTTMLTKSPKTEQELQQEKQRESQEKIDPDEVAQADGRFKNSEKGHCFVTLTNRRVIVTRLGSGTALAILVGLVLMLIFYGIQIAYCGRVVSTEYPTIAIEAMIAFSLAAPFGMHLIRTRAKRLSMLGLADRFSAYPEKTSQYPVQNITVQRSAWTGNKLIIGQDTYVFVDRKDVQRFDDGIPRDTK